jgi:hypothetical protein
MPEIPLSVGNISCQTVSTRAETLFYIIPYGLTILFEASEPSIHNGQVPVALTRFLATLALSSMSIARWRRIIPEEVRTPLLDMLWQDGQNIKFIPLTKDSCVFAQVFFILLGC